VARRLRFLREGRLLARLSHPNVVTVHDVVSQDGMTYLVMEWVDGLTLSEWLAARPRSRHQILAAFIQAGRGLSAAHELCIVHRDFKPQNVLIGRDARSRVADFGVAGVRSTSVAASKDTRVETPAHRASDPSGGDARTCPALTQAGAVLGTPAFMAPEQRAGKLATVQSDQYSFCLSLTRALDGASFPPSGRLRRALERGLSPDPAARHPSMAHLLKKLDEEVRPRPRFGLALILAASVVVAAWGGVAAIRALRSPCRSPARFLTGVWDTHRKENLQKTLALAGATPQLWQRVSSVFDEYGRDWTMARARACAGEAPVVARRLACLDDRIGELDARARLLDSAQPATIDASTDVAVELPPLAACSTPNVDGIPPPPSDPRTRSEVKHVRAAVEQVHVLLAADQAQASTTRRETERVRASAERLGYRPLLAEAALLQGDLAYWNDELSAARAFYRTAAAVADEAHHDRVRAIALTDLIMIDDQAPMEVILERAHAARAVLDRIGGDDHIENDRANALAVAFDLRDQCERALSIDLELIKRAGRTPNVNTWQLMVALRNAAVGAIHLGRRAEGERFAREAVAVGERWLEPNQPATRRARIMLAWVLTQIRSEGEALGLVGRALTVLPYDTAPPPDVFLNASSVYLDLGMDEAASMTAQQVASQLSPVSRGDALMNIGQVELRRGASGAALAHFREARKLFRQSSSVPARVDMSDLMAALARFDRTRNPDDLREARRALVRIRDCSSCDGEFRRGRMWLAERMARRPPGALRFGAQRP
jgi:serine/threonine protein kinase